ncbi:hypothetical protein V8E52_005626, partial [Russula decolorans]
FFVQGTSYIPNPLRRIQVLVFRVPADACGRRCAAIIPVESIICSVHLFPRFGPQCPRDWDSFSVLEQCNTFYVNPFSDRYNYLIFSG